MRTAAASRSRGLAPPPGWQPALPIESTESPVRIRLLTPLLLLVVLGVVVLEPWLPGRAWLEGLLGPNAVLRAALVATLGCLLLLWGESFRLHTLLTGLLAAMRQFRDGLAGQSHAAPSSQGNPQAKREAVRLLVAAMATSDPAIRQSCRQNLTRLVGQDLGDEPAAWQAWLDRQPPA